MQRNAVSVLDMDFYLPERVVANIEFADEHAEWNVASLEPRIGVRRRHVASDNETALDLAEKAVLRLFSRRPELRDGIDAILFCTESPDYKLPPNACILHGRLGCSNKVAAFDYNLACSGFPYGLAIARGLIFAGTSEKVLLVNADTYTKLIHPDDRSCRVLFGDGASAAVICAGDDGMFRIDDIILGTCGKQYEMFISPNSGCRKQDKDAEHASWKFPEHINMDGLGIRGFVMQEMPAHIEELLARNKLDKNDVDFWAFHQASGVILGALAKRLKISPETMLTNISEIGNTVSASIPILLAESLAKGIVIKGKTIVAAGFGVGLSWGSALLCSV